MKFSSEVLLKILNIIQEGLLQNTDVSQELRDLDIVPDDNDPEVLVLGKKKED